MSNPTTPFGWQMPTNTDLVTDLPADFEVFGQAVATSMQDLLGGTTGQILAKTSATDMDFTWTTPNPGDITGVTAGTGISGGGTSGDVTVTNSMATAITTSGDLIQGTGSGTFARLATGTSGQYLTTNGTTNSWADVSAGGMTLLETLTFSGASVTSSSIPGTYKNLEIIVRNFKPASDSRLNFRLNSDSGTNYEVVTGNNEDNVPSNSDKGIFGDGQDNTTATGLLQAFIPDYANTTTVKFILSYSMTNNGTTPANFQMNRYANFYDSTSAITTITFYPNTGNFTSGTALIYGVK